MNLEVKKESENQEILKSGRIRVSSTGKRLFAFLLDFIFALLIANTLLQIFRGEHWDLEIQSKEFSDLFPFYASIFFVLIFKDIFACSIGKFLLGMRIRNIDDFSKGPTMGILIKRNILILLLPLEVIVILRDAYARRIADKFWRTVVIDDKKAMRAILRIFLGNIILFGFFSLAILLQNSGIQKTAAFQTAEKAIRTNPAFQSLLEEDMRIEEPEMNLYLKVNAEKPSLVRARVGNDEIGKRVSVSLILRENPLSWEVLDIKFESIEELED